MNASIGKMPSWIFLVLVVTLASLHSSVAQFPWTKEPSSSIVVVEGVNNTNVRLEWDYDAAIRPSIVNVKIERKRDGTEKTIAVKGGQSSARPSSLLLKNRNQDGSEYEVLDPATLVLKEVNNDEEYEYVISVDYYASSSSLRPSTATKSVFVDVKVPPKIIRKPLNRRSEIGANVTLTCEAAGDPLPNITWTREGATTNQLDNVTGPSFDLVAVGLTDAGSYRCTAENGYGTVTEVASVSIICTSQCNTSTVGIRITEGAVWVDSLTNPNSAEFSGLANNLTAAISSPYSLPENEGKRPYEIKVNEFRPGSVRAFVDMEFPSNLSDPLKPLRDAMQDGKLGMFVVDPQLEINPTTSPPQSSTGSIQESKIPPDVGGRTSGLSNDIIWAIIGSCIAVVVIVAIIIIVCCVVRRKQSPGGSKGLYTEADGYRM
ncbi:PREDICTED: titin-like isoform X3 [Acropora digitifera]|uniref:titin-like isoform X3 n=1 Tax=Acropora digitifera TaxID=70779 RepID=UPI00077A7AFB|nr:PREDICTED: titin-like isoform X3 [Acropora digitifera]